MPRFIRLFPVLVLLYSSVVALAQVSDYARDPHQAINEPYTGAIRKYTTAPEFNSSLTDLVDPDLAAPPVHHSHR
jgi:hypothetical protein